MINLVSITNSNLLTVPPREGINLDTVGGDYLFLYNL